MGTLEFKFREGQFISGEGLPIDGQTGLVDVDIDLSVFGQGEDLEGLVSGVL